MSNNNEENKQGKSGLPLLPFLAFVVAVMALLATTEMRVETVSDALDSQHACLMDVMERESHYIDHISTLQAKVALLEVENEKLQTSRDRISAELAEYREELYRVSAWKSALQKERVKYAKFPPLEWVEIAKPAS
jgi:hypothetical protein